MEKASKNAVKRTKQSAESTILIRAARNAAKNAIRTSKALGLDITYIKKGIIYKETANGEIIELEKSKLKAVPKISLRKGMTLNAKN